jgi:hypothetical protein
MYIITDYESILYLRARNLDAENRLDFIDVGRIVDAIAAALNLRDDGDVHITFLREFLLREFLVASRLADGITGGLGDILRLFGCVVGGGGGGRRDESGR